MKREKRKEKEEMVRKHPDFSPCPRRGAGLKGKETGKEKGKGGRGRGGKGKGR